MTSVARNTHIPRLAASRCCCGRKHVQHLKFRHVAVIVVTARHAQVAQHKLWKEREIETDKHNQRRELSPAFRIKPSGNLWPPEMHASQVAHYRTTDHDVV